MYRINESITRRNFAFCDSKNIGSLTNVGKSGTVIILSFWSRIPDITYLGRIWNVKAVSKGEIFTLVICPTSPTLTFILYGMNPVCVRESI